METNLKEIQEHSYSWIEGFALGRSMTPYDGGTRQINWNQVKELIDSNRYDRIEVGLAEDYNQTFAVIYRDNKIVLGENDGSGFYGASYWATPAVKLFENGVGKLYECWELGNNVGYPGWLVSSTLENEKEESV